MFCASFAGINARMRAVTDLPKIKDYPREIVELACDRCQRYGRYSMKRILEKVRPDCEFVVAIKALADCRYGGGYRDPCQVKVVAEPPRWAMEKKRAPIGRVRIRED